MALERSLRVRVFDRDARPIELTAEGEVLLEQARLIIELADRVEERIRKPDRQGSVARVWISQHGPPVPSIDPNPWHSRRGRSSP